MVYIEKCIEDLNKKQKKAFLALPKHMQLAHLPDKNRNGAASRYDPPTRAKFMFG
jgi:hypothetical protein